MLSNTELHQYKITIKMRKPLIIDNSIDIPLNGNNIIKMIGIRICTSFYRQIKHPIQQLKDQQLELQKYQKKMQSPGPARHHTKSGGPSVNRSHHLAKLHQSPVTVIYTHPLSAFFLVKLYRQSMWHAQPALGNGVQNYAHWKGGRICPPANSAPM